jgi:transcriptional regulator with XRE-family HTH domain
MSIEAENAERIIREKGIKKGYVASMAGITPGSLSLMLHGRKIIKAEHVLLLAYALGCSPNELFGFPKPAQPLAWRLENEEP